MPDYRQLLQIFPTFKGCSPHPTFSCAYDRFEFSCESKTTDDIALQNLSLFAQFCLISFHIVSFYRIAYSGPVHTAPFFCTKMERKTSVFVKVFTLICQKRHKSVGFRKRYRKWISTKTEVFENAPILNNELHRTGAM